MTASPPQVRKETLIPRPQTVLSRLFERRSVQSKISLKHIFVKTVVTPEKD